VSARAQSLEEVNLYVRPPPGVRGDMIHCDIAHKHLTLVSHLIPHTLMRAGARSACCCALALR
jgi:hypothetical protein